MATERNIIACVHVSIPVGMTYDAGAEVSEENMRRDALGIFLDHPAIKGNDIDLLIPYVDKIVLEEEGPQG